MRLSPSALALEEDEQRPTEFGTGLRARLELVRTPDREPTPRRVSDISPELMLVSPDSGGVLAELLAQRVRETRRAPLGVLLAQAGLLDDAELAFALERARQDGKRIGEVLIEHGFVSSADVVRLVAEQRGVPFVDVASLPVDPAAARLLPADHARLFRTLPIGFVRGLPVVALADPSDERAIGGARSVLRAAEFVASPEESILAQLARLYIHPV